MSSREVLAVSLLCSVSKLFWTRSIADRASRQAPRSLRKSYSARLVKQQARDIDQEKEGIPY
jgi:hypothetical protein